MAERYSSFTPGGTAWLLQRITAAFLIVVLAFHFLLLHFVEHAWEITLAGSEMRMADLGYFLTMVLFLYAATFHGVNGVYNALINQGLAGTSRKVVLGILVVAGLLLAAQGTWVALTMRGMI